MELDINKPGGILPSLAIPGAGRQLSPTPTADYLACFQIMQAASKNYSFASRVLPPGKMHHVAALYAVMRVGDDRVDVGHYGFESPLAAIEDWQSSYWRAFETGDSPYPVLRAYVHTAHTLGISPDLLNHYFRAMIEDLTITRFATYDDLLHYMEGSAVPVGRIMTHILGTTSPHIADAYPAADALSHAMQLSNFWRDIGEDWRRGRVYIPREDLDRFGISESDLAAQRIDARFRDLLEFEFERTERYYEQARSGVAHLATGRLGVMSALELYHAILPGIRRNGYDVFTRRAGANRSRKFALLARAWWQVRQFAPVEQGRAPRVDSWNQPLTQGENTLE
ncbi:MAG: phytoene/squalene synthase family protein [Chloroflexi bacterium]|nr:phytoene/squalene synthase family protein [Chloroflexota bacterium]